MSNWRPYLARPPPALRFKLGHYPLPDRLLAPEEEQRFFAALPTDQWRDIFQLALWTGLRRSELAGLRGEHVDLRGQRLVLRQPKTGGEKVIPLVSEAVEILKRHPTEAGKPVFRSRYGRAFSHHRLGDIFRQATLSAGLDGLRLHDLRHTLATRLLQAGADLPTVGAILGHRPPYRATLRYVAHTSEERKRAALERLTSQITQQPKR